MTVESRPASPEEDLWSSILDSVSKSRSTPSKQILLLGEPRSGKTALAKALLGKKLDSDEVRDEFALGFDWADVRDEADEDVLARISVYTVQSSNSVHTSLIKQVLPPKTALSNTLVMIVLDWSKPWSFVEQLELWMKWIEEWAKSDSSRETEIAREEGRERLQYHFQHYTEPSDLPLPATTTTAALASSTLPLPQGALTSNVAGVPIIVVCTKADQIDDNPELGTGGMGAPTAMGGMVKSKGGEWEERTDGVMQVLRTICLKYGAALFYTTPLPSTTSLLRQYTLHYLFSPPAPSPSMNSANPTEIAPPRNLFKFLQPANALDRDRIVIPSGWDSWGKIKILRDEFEPSRWSELWERDMESFQLAPSTSNGINGTSHTISTNGIGGATESILAPPVPGGARAQYASLVGPDRGPPSHQLPTLIQPTPEQTFLQQHYETLSKDPARDPRQSFRQPAVAVEAGAITASASGSGGVGVGVVGPLGSSSFSLPSVEKALGEMEGGVEITGGRSEARPTERNPALGRSVAPGTTPARRDTRAVPPVQTGGAVPAGQRPLASPTTLGAGRAGQTQHEILHNFFQGLLTSRTGGGAGTGTGGGSAAASRSANASTEPGQTDDVA